MSANQNCHYFSAAPAHLRPLPRGLSPLRLVERLLFWCERAAQRRRLAELDDRMLRDIGVGRSEAYRESSKWFWQD